MNDKPEKVPTSGWQYNADGTAIELLPAGTPFVANDIYEFSYTAKDPTVNGVGFAAVRDWNAWLRYEAKDDSGTPNPLAGDITRIYTEVSSQPGRFLNDFRYLGFNQAENGKQVFDGMMQWIAAGDGISMNYRWSQPDRTERNRQDHLYVEGRFPFADVATTDPITGKTDSRYARCTLTHTCPFAMEIFSANEYWVKAASLMTTDPAGKEDLPDSPFTRIYFMSSMQHGTGNGASKGRLSAVAESSGFASSATSAVHGDGQMGDGRNTTAPESDSEAFGWDAGKTRSELDWIPSHTWRHIHGFQNHAVLAELRPELLRDGNSDAESANIRAALSGQSGKRPDLPELCAQDGRGWQRYCRRSPAGGSGAARDLHGLGDPRGAAERRWLRRFRPIHSVPKTKADRLASGDPRLSIEERYGNIETYSERYRAAIDNLVQSGYLLRFDGERIFNKNLNRVRNQDLFSKK